MTTPIARDQAIALVKEALAAGVLTPAVTSDWVKHPEETGKRLGDFIASAVEAAAKKIETI